MTTADYVIVGAGSAGCVLANRLSADGGTSVVLVEAGGDDRFPEIQVPSLFPRSFGGLADWGYSTVPQPELGDREVLYPRGRVLGGSSSLNAQLWTRGHRADYDGWAAAGNEGWSWEEVRPYFERAESGPIRLAQVPDPRASTPDFLTACDLLGYRPAGEQPEGYLPAQVTHSEGLRWNTAEAYLHPVASRPNLAVRTAGVVRRVVFDGVRAIGVEVETAKGARLIRAGREVILSAGSIGSAQLLQLSGVGAADALERLGIPVVAHSPEVGRNLSDHLLVPMAFAAANGYESPGVDAGPREIRDYYRGRHGPLGSNLAEALLFLRSQEDAPAPDVELFVMQVPFGTQAKPDRHGSGVGVMPLRPRSRGSVTLRSADPRQAPLIDPRYLGDEEGADLQLTLAAVRKAQEVIAQPVFAKWLGEPLTPGADAVADTELADYVRRVGVSIFHPVGSCRMGADERSVVDPRLRVRGTEGLRVVDASTLPSLTRGHPHAPTVMLAERASDLIRGC